MCRWVHRFFFMSVLRCRFGLRVDFYVSCGLSAQKKIRFFVKEYGIMLADLEKSATFASQLRKTISQGSKIRAFSSAGSEHLPYKQRVGGSNPSTPTREEQGNLLLFFCLCTMLFFRGTVCVETDEYVRLTMVCVLFVSTFLNLCAKNLCKVCKFRKKRYLCTAIEKNNISRR